MYSGITGKPMPASVFCGVVHYQRLRHMVVDKYQVINFTFSPHFYIIWPKKLIFHLLPSSIIWKYSRKILKKIPTKFFYWKIFKLLILLSIIRNIRSILKWKPRLLWVLSCKSSVVPPKFSFWILCFLGEKCRSRWYGYPSASEREKKRRWRTYRWNGKRRFNFSRSCRFASR